jgi:hypothetical protein
MPKVNIDNTVADCTRCPIAFMCIAYGRSPEMMGRHYVALTEREKKIVSLGWTMFIPGAKKIITFSGVALTFEGVICPNEALVKK